MDKKIAACKKLVVAGCLSQRYPAELSAEMPEVDHFLGSSDMLKLDTEELARERGVTTIDEQTLRQIWDTPHEKVAWTDEAWKRLQTSPDFVRSGIRKAAERRARKLGLKEIDSEHLTTFRNQAMMKAVKRIRSFGYSELTFDAFETALQKTKRLQGNEQAEMRLQEIRELKKMRGYKEYYRVRVGRYRLGFRFTKGEIDLLRFLPRKDLYRYFP